MVVGKGETTERRILSINGAGWEANLTRIHLPQRLRISQTFGQFRAKQDARQVAVVF